MKEFEITLRLRNNLLKRRRVELGLSPREFAQKAGVSHSLYLNYENLKRSPLDAHGAWKRSALLISNQLKILPEELWPKAVLSVSTPILTKEIHAKEVLALSGYQHELALETPLTPEDLLLTEERKSAARSALEKLTGRQRYVLLARAEGQTLEEIGEHLEVGRERVRQIEIKAMKRLRHPSTRMPLRRAFA